MREISRLPLNGNLIVTLRNPADAIVYLLIEELPDLSIRAAEAAVFNPNRGLESKSDKRRKEKSGE